MCDKQKKSSHLALVRQPNSAKHKTGMSHAGMVFDCDEHGGPVAGGINLMEAEPMQMAGLWSCIYDAMYCNTEISRILDPNAGGKVCLMNADYALLVCLYCKAYADWSWQSGKKLKAKRLGYINKSWFGFGCLGHLPLKRFAPTCT